MCGAPTLRGIGAVVLPFPLLSGPTLCVQLQGPVSASLVASENDSHSRPAVGRVRPIAASAAKLARCEECSLTWVASSWCQSGIDCSRHLASRSACCPMRSAIGRTTRVFAPSIRPTVPEHEEWSIYFHGYLSSIEVPEDRLEAAIETLIPVWKGPSRELWRRVLSGSVDGLRALGNADLRLGIVSNSDGLVQELLARNEICQVGPGPGVQVLTIVDSGVVGVAKPDPRIFDIALASLGLDPSDVIYVGDSVKYDVRSAEGAGMTPLHFDPFGLCDGTDHAHVAHVDQVLRYV